MLKLRVCIPVLGSDGLAWFIFDFGSEVNFRILLCGGRDHVKLFPGSSLVASRLTS